MPPKRPRRIRTRRGHGPPPPLHGPRNRAIQQMYKANRLMKDGQFAEAATIFERLSTAAEKADMPHRVSMLAGRAGQAALQADDIEAAERLMRRAVRFSLEADNEQLAAWVARRAIEGFTEQGYTEQAAALREEWGQLAETPPPTSTITPPPDANLPPRCDACLGPVRSDEVQWIDNTSAACAYCGATLKVT